MNPQNQPPGQDQDRHDFQAGQTISPREYNPSPAPAAPQQPGTEPADQHLYRGADIPELMPAPYDPAAPLNAQMQDNGREVTWTALEFIAHQKSPNWFVALGGSTLILAILVFVITRDWVNTGVVIIAAIIFGVAAARPPREMHYTVDEHGIEIGRRFYPYSEFRSFSISEEGPFRSLVFMPLKRFVPPLSAYYDPADEDRIGEVLITHLPMHGHQRDLTERLMHRIRF